MELVFAFALEPNGLPFLPLGWLVLIIILVSFPAKVTTHIHSRGVRVPDISTRAPDSSYRDPAQIFQHKDNLLNVNLM